MTGITWQQAALALTVVLTSTGVITFTDLFGVLFSLKGMDYNFTGDIHCGSECNISINTTTSYWRYEFANYSGTKYENKTLFKKQSRSRTLHVNMDNINKIITTQKLLDNGSWISYNVPVDWNVPTYGHKWRPVKDGDSWERSKVNKIILTFHKNQEDTIKWSFGLDDYVDIDPILFPPYNITDNIVSVDDDYVNLKAYPHTLADSGYVTFNLTSKQFNGDIDVIWGFNSTGAMPKSAGLSRVNNVTDIRTYTCDSPYRYNYTTTPKYFWCWHDYNVSVTDNETNITTNISKTDLIFEHYFDSAYPQNKSVSWSETHVEDYVDIHDKMNKVNFYYGGMDTWYYTKNVQVSAGTEYSVRAWIDVPFNSGYNKYWFCVKPSLMTIQQAQSNGHLYCLDPWWNSSWSYYRPIEVNVSENVTDYQLLINITNKTNAQNDCSDMRFTLEDNVTELNYWIEYCNVSLDYALLWVNVTLDTYNGTQIGYWYGNSTAVTSQSDENDTLGADIEHFYPIHGNILDKIGSLDGSAIATPTLTTDQHSRVNYSYDLDVGDGFNLGASTDWDLDSENRSFVFWYKADTTAVYQIPFGRQLAASPWTGYYMMAVDVGAANSSFAMIGETQLVSDTPKNTNWHHYVVTASSAGILKMYVDGVKATQTLDTGGTAVDTTRPFALGGTRIEWVPSDGKISEFRTYGRELGQSDVDSMYIATEPTYSIGDEQSDSAVDAAPTYSDNLTNSTVAGTDILHSLKWEDETALSGYIFEFCNGTWNGTDCVVSASDCASGHTDNGDGTCTMQLQTADTENLEDTRLVESTPTSNYGLGSTLYLMNFSSGDQRQLLKFNITSIPDGVTITDSRLYIWTSDNGLDASTEGFNVSVHHHYNLTWVESYPKWNNFGTLGSWNATGEDDIKIYGGAGEPSGWDTNWNTTIMVTKADDANDASITFFLLPHDVFGSPIIADTVATKSKEYATDTSLRPYVNITYIPTAGASSSWTNDSFASFSGVANYSNVTKYVNSTVGANIAWRVYANDSSDNWTLSLTYNYTTTSAAEDSCTCPGINNNWNMDMGDWCNITANCDLGTGTWNLTGTGEVRCNATITTTDMEEPPSGSILWIQNNCWIKVT